MASVTPEKLKSLFGDLGKPTMRGVRKCPKCGTLNGTRGISCKNKHCDVIFKEKEKKKGHSADAVKIVTGSTVQVFSVRLRDRGPDYRGFVQLPLVQDIDGNPAENVDPAVLAQAARCYVDACSRNSTTIPAQQPACAHIKSAIGCSDEAHPLTLKNSVLNSLQVSNEMKQAIWLLATETTGPLVQRVTKNIMIVKCKPNSKHPLGFLHFSFFETSRNRAQLEHKFQCSCKAFKTVRIGLAREETQKRCVHFYACICAFASDDKLSDEFSYYINLDDSLGESFSDINEIPTSDQLITIISPTSHEAIASTGSGDEEDIVDTADTTSVEVIIDDEGILTASEHAAKRQKFESESDDILMGSDSLAQASSALLTLQESTQSQQHILPPQATLKKPSPVKPPAKPVSTPKKTGIPVDETTITLGFHEWLASVTERINQTMHYQFDGNPDPLVFHAPQKFFDCVQQRISAGNKKKRLPNSTTGFVRKDALPLGTFTKYTWHITNILHVKQIFDTSDMPLEITRSFVENRDNTYDPYEAPRMANDTIDVAGKHPQPIRPFELKTYLKVGNTSPDQKEPTPFIIEWIPDILPKLRIGELRIKFEYGHQRNGQIEHRITTTTASVPASVDLEMQAIRI